MVAWRQYQALLCPGGCGFLRSEAHHPDNDGWYETEDERPVCHACTAAARARSEDSDREAKPVDFIYVAYTRPTDKPLPPLTTADLD